MGRVGLSIWVGVALGACSSQSPISTIGGGHGTAHSLGNASTNASSSGATGAGSTGSSTASTTNGTAATGSTGSTGGATSSSGGVPAALDCSQPLDACDAGQVELLAQVWDALAMHPLGQVVEIQNLLNPTEDTETNPDGILTLCLPVGTVVAPELQVNGYVTTIFNDIVMNTSQCFPALELFSDAVWNELTNYQIQPPSPAFDQGLGAVVVGFSGLSTCDSTGWTVWATQADGGPVTAPVVYGQGSTMLTSVPPTGIPSLALIYNLDLSLGAVRVQGSWDGGPQAAGVTCTQQPIGEFDGLVQIAGNGVISSYSFAVTGTP